MRMEAGQHRFNHHREQGQCAADGVRVATSGDGAALHKYAAVSAQD
jgi:hypothetical protein